MKIYNFRPIFHNFNENFAIFTKFSKKIIEFFAKIWENIFIKFLRRPGSSAKWSERISKAASILKICLIWIYSWNNSESKRCKNDTQSQLSA